MPAPTAIIVPIQKAQEAVTGSWVSDSTHRAVAGSTSFPTTAQSIGLIPVRAGVKILDVVLDVDDLDSNGSPAITLNVGFFYNDATTNVPAQFFSAVTTAQAGGVVRRTIAPTTPFIPATEGWIGVIAQANAATAQTGNITLQATLSNLRF